MPSDLIQYKKKGARQIHNTSQLSNRAKKDKVKKILEPINEIQFQDSCSSDEESVTVPPNKVNLQLYLMIRTLTIPICQINMQE
jgi:hypothetical protein